MSLSANTVWEIRTGGASTNGGGFVTGASGTDYSQQDAAQYALTGVTTAGADAILLDASAASNMVGNICQIVSGTNFTAGYYQILSVSVGVSITLDRTCTSAAGSTGVVNIGGALATHDSLTAVVAGNTIYTKSGTYTRTTAWAQSLIGTTTAKIILVGYDTTRTPTNTDATRPLITTSTDSVALIAGNGNQYLLCRNLRFTSTAATETTCFTNATAASDVWFYNCYFSGFTSVNPNSGTASANYNIRLNYCEITGCSNYAILHGNASPVVVVMNSYIHGNAGGINYGSTGGFVRISNSIISDNTGWGFISTRTTSSTPAYDISNTTFYNNTSGGIRYDTTSAVIGSGNTDVLRLENNIFYGGAYGVSINTAAMHGAMHGWRNNAFGNQGTAPTLNMDYLTGTITLSADPFSDAAGGDFSLNSTAGGGALLRGLGFPSELPGGLTDNFRDVGAVQHEDTGGGAAVETSSGYIY